MLLVLTGLAIAWPHLAEHYTNTTQTTDSPVQPDATDPASSQNSDAAPKQENTESTAEEEKELKLDPARLKADPGSYLAGQFAALKNDHRNATDHLRDALTADPDNNELKRQLYHLLLLEGSVDAALEVAETVTDNEIRKSLASDVLRAVRHIREENYSEALPHLGASHSGGLNAILMPLLTTWTRLGAGEIKNPLTVAQVIGGNAKLDTPFVIYHLALMNDLLGHTSEARRFFEQATKEPAKTPYRILESTRNFYLRQKDSAAVNALVSAATQGGKTLSFDTTIPASARLIGNAREGVAELFYSIASILYGANAVEDEIVYLRMALYLRPQFPAAQYLLAAALEQAENLDAAVIMYQRIENTSPLYIGGQVRIAQILHERGDTPAALRTLETVAANPNYSEEALLAKGDLLRDMERFSEAAAVYSHVIDQIKTPTASDWVKYYARGIAYERAGQWPKAEADFARALELEPDQPEVLNYKGYSWLTMNKHIPEAKDMIERALKQRPNDAHIIDSMGWAYYLIGDFEQAAEYIEEALEQMPGDPTVNEHLGDVYWRLGRRMEARFQWERALTFKPDAKATAAIKEKLANGMPPFVPAIIPESSEAPAAPEAGAPSI